MSHISNVQQPHVTSPGFHIWPHKYKAFLSLQTVPLASTAPLRDNQDEYYHALSVYLGHHEKFKLPWHLSSPRVSSHLTNLSPGGEGDAFLIWLNRLLLHSLWNSLQGSIKSLQLSTSSESSLRLLALTERWLPSEDTASPWAFSSTGLFLLPNSTVLLTWTVG